MQAIIDLSMAELLKALAIGLPLALMAICINMGAQYTAEVARLHWRRVLVHQVQQRYFRGRLAYWLNCVDVKIDNVDQRMTQE